jgi:hypothetical protein
VELVWKGEGVYSYMAEGRSRDVASGECFTTTDEHGAQLLADRSAEFAAAAAPAAKAPAKRRKPASAPADAA